MNSIEALNELIDEIKYTHNDGKTLTDYDAKLVKIIERDLEVLEAVKNSLIIEEIPPKPYFNPNDDYNIELAIQHIIRYNQYKLNKEIKEKLTKWIIENIDKETIKGWLENERTRI